MHMAANIFSSEVKRNNPDGLERLTLYIKINSDLLFSKMLVVGSIKLTPRETDILSCLANGRTSQKLIADILRVSPRTAEKHIQSAAQKILLNTGKSVHVFIESSGKINTLRAHYEDLLKKHYFYRALSQLEKANRKNIGSICLEMDEGVNPIMRELIGCLQFAGVRVGKEDLQLQVLIKRQDVDTEPQEAHSNVYTLVIEILSHLMEDKKSFQILREESERLLDINQEKLARNTSPALSEKNKRMTWFSRNSILVVSLLIFVCVMFINIVGEKYKLSNVVSRVGGQQMEMPVPIKSKLLERKTLLVEIDRILSTRSTKQDISYVGILGVGGSGKTILARMWAKEYAAMNNKAVVWEINAETLETYKASLRELSTVLANSPEKKEELKYIESLSSREDRERRLLLFIQANIKLQPNWVLILDNLESVSTLTGYIPTNVQIWGDGVVLVTSRNKNIGSSDLLSKDDVINLQDLSKDEAYQLFIKIRYGSQTALSNEDILDVNKYLKEIPAFPLDISLAANYLSAHSGALRDYAFKLSHLTEGVDEMHQHFLEEISHYPNTRYGIIALSCEKLLENDKHFADILLILSLIETQKIPSELLGVITSKQYSNLAITGLQKHALINLNTPKDALSTLSLHRSTQDMLKAFLMHRLRLEENDGSMQRVVEKFISYTNESIDQENRAVLSVLEPHLQKLIRSNLINEMQKLRIKGALGCIFYYLGNISQSIDLLESVTSQLKDARMLMHLGAAHRLKSQFRESESALKKSIDVYKHEKNISGEVDAVLALSHMYLGQGRYLEAKKLIESIKDPVLDSSVGFMPRLRMHWVKNLVTREFGKYDEAISEINESIKLLDERKIRDDRYLIALRLLAHTLGEMDNYAESIKIFKKVLRDLERGNGKDFYYWQTMSQLSYIYRKVGQYREAKDGFYQTLKYYQENSEKDEIETAWCYAEIAKLLSFEYDEGALQYIEKAYKTYLQRFQENSLKLAWINLVRGEILVKIGKLSEARKYLEVSLERHKSLLGEDHPRTAKTKIYLGYCLFNVGEASGISLLKEGYDTYKSIYGSDHLRMALPGRLLGECYLRKQELSKAEELLSFSMKIYSREKHQDLYLALQALAKLNKEKGNVEESRRNQDRALIEAKKVLPNNSLVIKRLENLDM